MEKKIILLSLAPSRIMPEYLGKLEAAGDGREAMISSDPAEVEKVLERVEIGFGDIPYTLIPRMPNFKWWQLWSAGADVLLKFPALKECPFLMSTSSGIHGQQIAEHLFAMLLGWNRRMGEAYEAQKQRKWLFIGDSKLAALAGKTMLILGYGAVGRTVAQAALAFGLKVIGLRRNPAGPAAVPAAAQNPQAAQDAAHGDAAGCVLQAEAAKLHGFLPQADYVVNILPSTPDTQGFFGEAEFKLMKSSALYINVGRGATTREADLIDALRDKTIAGALLDVVETEPLPEDSKLWDMDNVIITGHYAGCHPDYSRLAMSVALENLERYKRGEKLKNLVDKQKGY